MKRWGWGWRHRQITSCKDGGRMEYRNNKQAKTMKATLVKNIMLTGKGTL